MEAVITLLDTGDFYVVGHNELLIREMLQGYKRDNAFIAVKFGTCRCIKVKIKPSLEVL